MPDEIKDITELEAEVARLKSELEKTKERERALEDSRKAMLYMLEDLEENRKQIKLAKEEWEKTFDSITDLISINDTNYQVTRVNMAMANRLGKRPGDLIGKKCYEVYHGTVCPWPECPHSQVLETRAPAVKELESEILGGIFMVSIFPLFSKEGRFIGTVHVLKDITEKKKLEEEARLKRRFEDIIRFRSEFIASMSHELRTPLNSIIGFSELLIDGGAGELNEKQARYVRNVHESGKHLLNLIDDILDISKVDAGKVELRPEEFSLTETLEVALEIIRPQAAKKGLSMRLEMEPGIPIIKADPVRFKQIMYNLLSNAVKFTLEGGQVRVAAHKVSSPQSPVFSKDKTITEDWGQKTEDWVQISVADTGLGIRPEDMPKLFKEFTQLDTTLSRGFHGPGLGLSITKRLVELHGGRIWAESEGEGRGTTFTFILPLLQDAL